MSVVCVGSVQTPEEVSGLLELQWQALGSCPMWELETELRSLCFAAQTDRELCTRTPGSDSHPPLSVSPIPRITGVWQLTQFTATHR